MHSTLTRVVFAAQYPTQDRRLSQLHVRFAKDSRHSDQGLMGIAEGGLEISTGRFGCRVGVFSMRRTWWRSVLEHDKGGVCSTCQLESKLDLLEKVSASLDNSRACLLSTGVVSVKETQRLRRTCPQALT